DDLFVGLAVDGRWSCSSQRPSVVDPRLARRNHHYRLVTPRGRHRAHRLSGHRAETCFNILRIANNPANSCYHLARAWWLSQLQGILDQNMKCPERYLACQPWRGGGTSSVDLKLPSGVCSKAKSRRMYAFGGKAEMPFCTAYVCL